MSLDEGQELTSRLVPQDIGRVDVLVDHVAGVDLLHRAGQLDGQVQPGGEVQIVPLDELFVSMDLDCASGLGVSPAIGSGATPAPAPRALNRSVRG